MDKTYQKPEPMPLFKENARNSHPNTSRRRAADLSMTARLSNRMMFTLALVYNHPGKTAAELSRIMFTSGNYETLDKLEWPHKAMSRLVDEKLVRREDVGKNGEICFITRDGKERLGVV